MSCAIADGPYEVVDAHPFRIEDWVGDRLRRYLE